MRFYYKYSMMHFYHKSFAENVITLKPWIIVDKLTRKTEALV